MNIEDKLSKLNDQQKDKVYRLIDKLYNKNGGRKEEIKASTKPTKRQPGTQRRPKKYKKSSGVGEKIAIAQPLKIGKRVNIFDSMPDKDSHKRDTLIDKKLAINPPTPRGTRASLVEAECRNCGEEYTVSAKLLDENGRFVCDGCCTSKR